MILNRGKEAVMADKKVPKCAHPGCECPAAKGSKYCGSYCEGAGNSPSIACNCGHAQCAAEEAAVATG